ncbi:hypothetical protein CTRI78_v010638 [Colletotrichum trifolii]|uniref:CENP-V/GFA domain-containing protein n=1 Tax=Colletotrichum trifolii TaxID=5466 RepID=A0A4R8QJP6_COLTR|nr:hypothetical protein CTRI78_v010638 [Colletotrichum trifolii]
MSAEPNTRGSFPLSNLTSDGWSTETEATATCLCGAVQLAFPTAGPGLVDSFLCHCADCRKISSSMFCSNFTVDDEHLRHVRGRDNLKAFGQSATVATGNKMTNYFCDTCGTLLYRASSGAPGYSILRLGTVDDFSLVEGKMKPRCEDFVGTRASWLTPVEGAAQVDKMHSARDVARNRSL